MGCFYPLLRPPQPGLALIEAPGKHADLAKTKPVVPLLLAFRSLRRAVAAVLRDPETRALPLVAGALLLTGTIFYWRAEDWTIIQALYFSVVTLTTIGYGDFTPTSAGTQIFTIIYILTGLGVFVEARLHIVNSEGGSTKFLPITVGIKF